MIETLNVDEAKTLLQQVRNDNEIDLAAAKDALAQLTADGSGTENLTDDLAAARHMEADAANILKAVDAALERIESGSYGICSLCGQPVAAERLRLRPYITTCIACADKP